MLINSRRALLLSAGCLVGAAVVGLLLALPATGSGVQSLDDAVWRLAGHARWAPLVWLAKVLALIGGTWVNWPVRVLAAVLLAVRRRWLQLAAFALAVATSEVLIGTLKAAFARARPPDSLIGTSDFSFPSGHAIATAVTAVGLVVVLLPPGRKRWAWEVRAVLFTFLMALSRVYLRAHWLSDVVAGSLLGAGLAIGWPALLMQLRDRRSAASATAAPAAGPTGVTATRPGDRPAGSGGRP